MNTEQILKVLKNERECIKRQNGKCDRNCAKCDLCLPDTEILEVYDFLIEAYSITEIHINVSKEESEKLFEIINRNAKDHTRLAVIPYPDIGECYPTVTFTEEPLTEFDVTPLSGDFKTVALSRPFERVKENLNKAFGIKQPGKVMADFWQKGDTE